MTMKTKLILALTLSVLAANTFAADGFDRTQSAIAADGYDRTGAATVAADGFDRTGSNTVAEAGYDRTGSNAIAEDGFERTGSTDKLRVGQAGDRACRSRCGTIP